MKSIRQKTNRTKNGAFFHENQTDTWLLGGPNSYSTTTVGVLTTALWDGTLTHRHYVDRC